MGSLMRLKCSLCQGAVQCWIKSVDPMTFVYECQDCGAKKESTPSKSDVVFIGFDAGSSFHQEAGNG